MNRIVLAVVALFVLIILSVMSSKLGEHVDANEIVFVQDPIDGELHMYTQPGWVSQNFGTVTHYHKSFSIFFGKKDEAGNEVNNGIKVRFNDGGHATLSGSARIDLPIDFEHMSKLHITYGSEEAIRNSLVRPTIEKAVYMTGPLMSSKESYAEKRNDLLSFIDDQAVHGVFKTHQKDIQVTDQLTNQSKTQTIVDIVKDSSGVPLRQEISPIGMFNIHVYALSINDINYDAVVDKQIQVQQQAYMNVQTAIMNAKKAEQDAITAEQQGKAAATEAKWQQEIIKAKLVTEAEQKKEVARLEMEAAEYTKQKEIKLGEGESTRKKLAQQSNGSLEIKLDALKEINSYWADASGKYQGNVTPTYMMGGSGGGYNATQNFMELLNMKTMKELNLDLKPNSK